MAARKQKAPAGQDAARSGQPPEKAKNEARHVAAVALDPAAHGMASLRLFSQGSFGKLSEAELFHVLAEHAEAAKRGDLKHYRALLAMQADALNGIFTEMARRAAANMGDYLGATQTYLRLGLKAQAQCRSTIESLERLTSGHVQTVKHVHVNEGGQAVIADQFHHHTGGQENGQAVKQPHATGTGAAGPGTALPCPDPLGQAVPIPGGEGPEALPDAWGEGQRGT